MKIGDRVMLTERLAATIEKSRQRMKRMPKGWKDRHGTLVRITRTGQYGVQWDGRTSFDYLDPRGLRLESEYASSSSDVLGKGAAHSA